MELPKPSSFPLDNYAASSKEVPEGFPEDSPEGIPEEFLEEFPEEDSDALTEDSDVLTENSDDELQLDWAIQSDGDDEEPRAWTLSAIRSRADRDLTDWMFDPNLYASYDLMCGPFDLDACADIQGHNAQCARYWSPEDCYSKHSWAGLKIWCNRPF